MIKMENATEMYVEEISPSNEIKGFTKSFVKRTKAKREEDFNVKDLISYVKSGSVTLGAKSTEKNFKKGIAEKVYASSNCDVLTLKKIKYYAKLANVEIVELELDNAEMAQKIAKPFLISMVCVIKGGNK